MFPNGDVPFRLGRSRTLYAVQVQFLADIDKIKINIVFFDK